MRNIREKRDCVVQLFMRLSNRSSEINDAIRNHRRNEETRDFEIYLDDRLSSYALSSLLELRRFPKIVFRIEAVV